MFYVLLPLALSYTEKAMLYEPLTVEVFFLVRSEISFDSQKWTNV